MNKFKRFRQKHWFEVIICLLAFFVLCTIGNCQLTSVTATVTDSDSQTWNNAQWKVQFVPNPSQPNQCIYNVNGVGLCTSTYLNYLAQSGTSNGSGALSVTLIDNTQISPAGSQWVWTIQSNTSAPATQYLPLTISGASMNLSTYLSINSIAPRIKIGNSAGIYAYLDIEITNQTQGNLYWDVTTQASRQWTGSAWQNLVTSSWNGGTVVNPITAPSFTGPLTGNVTGNVTGSLVGPFVNSSVNGIYNITQPPGGQAIAKSGEGVTDGVFNATSTVTSASANFTSAMTGWLISAVCPADTATSAYIGTMTYVSATQITVSPTPSFSCNPTLTGQAYGATMYFSQNNSTALQAALTASQNTNCKLPIYIPTGVFVFNTQLTINCAAIIAGDQPGAQVYGYGVTGSILVSQVTGGSNYALSIGNGSTFNSGGFLSNFSITGAMGGSNGIYEQNVGNMQYVTGVAAFGFTGGAFNNGYLQDTVFLNDSFQYCGYTNGSYCFTLGSLSNYIHIKNLMLTSCPGCFYANSVSTVDIEGGHFENSVDLAGRPLYTTCYSSSPFNISDSVGITFADVQWQTPSVDYLVTCNGYSSPSQVVPAISAFGDEGFILHHNTMRSGGNPTQGGAVWFNSTTNTGVPSDTSIIDHNTFIGWDIRVPMITQQMGIFDSNTATCYDNGTTTNMSFAIFSGVYVNGNTLNCANSAGVAKTTGSIWASATNGSNIPTILGTNNVNVQKQYQLFDTNAWSSPIFPYGISASSVTLNGLAPSYNTPDTTVIDNNTGEARIISVGPTSSTHGSFSAYGFNTANTSNQDLVTCAPNCTTGYGAFNTPSIAVGSGGQTISNSNLLPQIEGTPTVTTIACWKTDNTLGYATMSGGNISACN
jgi:hypothetical protein